MEMLAANKMLNAKELLKAKEMLTAKEMLNAKKMLKAKEKIKNKKIPQDKDTIVEHQARMVSPEWITNANQDQLLIAVEMMNSVAPSTAIDISTVSDRLGGSQVAFTITNFNFKPMHPFRLSLCDCLLNASIELIGQCNAMIGWA